MKYLGFASVLVSRKEGYGTVTSMTHSYRHGVGSEDEMRGIAVEHALKAKKGFAVDDVIISLIETNDVTDEESERQKQLLEYYTKTYPKAMKSLPFGAAILNIGDIIQKDDILIINGVWQKIHNRIYLGQHFGWDHLPVARFKTQN